MRIEYTLAFREYLRHYPLRFRHMARVVPVLFFIACSGIVAFFICPAASMLFQHYTSPFSLPASIEREEIVIAVIPYVELPVLLSIIMPIDWLLHRRRWLTIGPDGIDCKQHWRKYHLPWRRIAQIEEDAEFLCFGSKTTAIGAVVFAAIPKRAFPAPAEAEAFFGQANRYWNEATEPTPAAEGAWPPAPREG